MLDALNAAALPGVIDLTPGVRSLQVHFDCRRTSRKRILDALQRFEESLPPSMTSRSQAALCIAAVLGRSVNATGDRALHAVGAG